MYLQECRVSYVPSVEAFGTRIIIFDLAEIMLACLILKLLDHLIHVSSKVKWHPHILAVISSKMEFDSILILGLYPGCSLVPG